MFCSVTNLNEILKNDRFRGKSIKLTADATIYDFTSDATGRDDLGKLEILDTYKEKCLIAHNMTEGRFTL